MCKIGLLFENVPLELVGRQKIELTDSRYLAQDRDGKNWHMIINTKRTSVNYSLWISIIETF